MCEHLQELRETNEAISPCTVHIWLHVHPIWFWKDFLGLILLHRCPKYGLELQLLPSEFELGKRLCENRLGL
ncbi:hypothetical protein MRX96_037292 [Rhipicephalus microplus]